jgi:hypothetical protein
MTMPGTKNGNTSGRSIAKRSDKENNSHAAGTYVIHGTLGVDASPTMIDDAL